MDSVCYQPTIYTESLAKYFIQKISQIRDFSNTTLKSTTSIRSKIASDEVINSDAGRILDEYGNAILRMAYTYLHNMNDSEDILQNTLIKYMQSAPSFENKAHEKAWLVRVASNLSKNAIDYNRIRNADELNESLVAEEREDLAFVWEAVNELPTAYREAIHLYYYEGYSTAEISKILNRKESSVRSDLKRGRDKLKGILKEAYDFE